MTNKKLITKSFQLSSEKIIIYYQLVTYNIQLIDKNMKTSLDCLVMKSIISRSNDKFQNKNYTCYKISLS